MLFNYLRCPILIENVSISRTLYMKEEGTIGQGRPQETFTDDQLIKFGIKWLEVAYTVLI